MKVIIYKSVMLYDFSDTEVRLGVIWVGSRGRENNLLEGGTREYWVFLISMYVIVISVYIGKII